MMESVLENTIIDFEPIPFSKRIISVPAIIFIFLFIIAFIITYKNIDIKNINLIVFAIVLMLIVLFSSLQQLYKTSIVYIYKIGTTKNNNISISWLKHNKFNYIILDDYTVDLKPFKKGSLKLVIKAKNNSFEIIQHNSGKWNSRKLVDFYNLMNKTKLVERDFFAV